MVRVKRRRYLLFSVHPQGGPLPAQSVKSAIFRSIVELFGLYGLSQADLKLIAYDEEGGRGLIRCSHTSLDKLRVALLAIREIEGRLTAIHTVTVSGTLKSIRDRGGGLPRLTDRKYKLKLAGGG